MPKADTPDEFPPEVVEAVARAMMGNALLWRGAYDGATNAAGAMERDAWRSHARAALGALSPAARAVLTGQAVAVPADNIGPHRMAVENALFDGTSLNERGCAIAAEIAMNTFRAASPWAPRDE